MKRLSCQNRKAHYIIMNVYILLTTYIFLVWLLTKKGRIVYTISELNIISVNAFMMLSFVACFLISSLRGKFVGKDTISYIRYYKEVGQLTWSGLREGLWDNHYFTTEKGFMILEKILSDISIPSQLFISICSLFFIYGVYKLSCKYVKESVLVSIFTFLAMGGYLASMNAMRQGIGVGLCCLAWVRLKEENYKRFVLDVIIASTFHISCCVFLGAVFLKKIPASKKNILFLMIGFITFGIFGVALMPFVLSFVPTYAFRYGRGRWDWGQANGVIIVWIIIILVMLLMTFKKDWSDEKNHIDFEIMILALCYVSINMIGLVFDGAQRLSLLFQPFLILLFDRSCGLWEKKTKYIYKFCVITCMFVFFYKASSTEQYIYMPYWVHGG